MTLSTDADEATSALLAGEFRKAVREAQTRLRGALAAADAVPSEVRA